MLACGTKEGGCSHANINHNATHPAPAAVAIETTLETRITVQIIDSAPELRFPIPTVPRSSMHVFVS
jgi:hypothetical protein